MLVFTDMNIFDENCCAKSIRESLSNMEFHDVFLMRIASKRCGMFVSRDNDRTEKSLTFL